MNTWMSFEPKLTHPTARREAAEVSPLSRGHAQQHHIVQLSLPSMSVLTKHCSLPVKFFKCPGVRPAGAGDARPSKLSWTQAVVFTWGFDPSMSVPRSQCSFAQIARREVNGSFFIKKP